MVVYKDPTAWNQILLLEEDTYFHSCILYITFLEKSYFCHEYNCGHDQEKFRHHPSVITGSADRRVNRYLSSPVKIITGGFKTYII